MSFSPIRLVLCYMFSTICLQANEVPFVQSVSAIAASGTAKAEDVESAKNRLQEYGPKAKATFEGELLTEIVISDGSFLTAEDLALFGRLTDLRKLQILNSRGLNTEMVSKLTDLKDLTSLSLTNTVIDDAAVELIVASFPRLVDLDLSSNANMSSQILKPLTKLKDLQQLTLVQDRLNEISTRKLAKMENLKILDLRGNMEAGDMTMEVLAALPKLKAFKHRSTAVTDYGMEMLAGNATLENMLIQDFAITNQSGKHIAKLKSLTQLEIFRCQGFGNEGVLALKGSGLQRLTLRDLPIVNDTAMEVLKDLPKLKKLYLRDISGITDQGLKNLASLESLELLELWTIPVTSATMGVIESMKNLKELSLRSTSVDDVAIDTILAMPGLHSLTLKENGAVTSEAIKKLSKKQWKKLDTGL
jgi:Leucine-rich repeat (LRR) protein